LNRTESKTGLNRLISVRFGFFPFQIGSNPMVLYQHCLSSSSYEIQEPAWKKKYWPLLEQSTQPNPIHIVDLVVYHKSHFVSVFFTPWCVINVKETHHQIQTKEKPKNQRGEKQETTRKGGRGSGFHAIHQIQQK